MGEGKKNGSGNNDGFNPPRPLYMERIEQGPEQLEKAVTMKVNQAKYGVGDVNVDRYEPKKRSEERYGEQCG